MRKGLLALAGMLATAAAVLALVARNAYASTEAARGYLYAAQGYGVARAEEMAARDASAAIGGHVTMAWMLFALGLALLVAAIARPGQTTGVNMSTVDAR